MTRNYQISGGVASWVAALVDMRKHPQAAHRFVFADTLYEDADAYRFLLEGIARLLGRSTNWIPKAEEFPDYRVIGLNRIEDYSGNREWRAFLAALRARAAVALPELVWLVEGRDPWEVYRDERFLGNSGADPCSKILKRQMIARWVAENCDPAVDVLIFGIGEHEAHRFYGGKGQVGIRTIYGSRGWRTEAPLVEAIEGCRDPLAFLDDFRILRPRLYGRNYIHNNCGGLCCKAGKAHWRNRLSVHRERFAYDALLERLMRAFLGADVAMMEDRRGGERRPLTLDEFEAEVLGDPAFVFEYEAGDSGCGCATEYTPDDFAPKVAA